jgi:hypothetical protein
MSKCPKRPRHRVAEQPEKEKRKNPKNKTKNKIESKHK